MRKFIFTILVLIAGVVQSNAQHTPLFSQYLFNGLVINPAYAMGKDGLRTTLDYKKQWVSFPGAPTTLTGTFQSSFKNEQYNFGAIVFNDKYGLNTQTDALGNFAYRIKTGKGQLGLGLSGGMSIMYFNKNKINTVDKDDEVFSGVSYYNVAPKIGMGFYYHTSNFFAGISAPQWILGSSNEKIPGILRRTLMFNTGYTFELNHDIKLTPSFLGKYISGSPFQIDYNLIASFKDLISGGVSYRKEAIVFLLQYTRNNFSFGYAYDIARGDLSPYTSGSHEFMLRYDLRYGLNLPDPKKL